MAISQSEFGVAVNVLRPRLLQAARLLLRCSYEDAEDAVSEVVIVALSRLDDYQESTGMDGLRYWLVTIMNHIGHRRTRAGMRKVPTVPLQTVEANLSGGQSTGGPDFQEALRTLHPLQRLLVTDWLDGYSQVEIARRLRIHRNTVQARLQQAFAGLREKIPDIDTLEYSLSPFAACARVTLYRKPAAPWLPWREQHPPEAPWRRSPKLLRQNGT